MGLWDDEVKDPFDKLFDLDGDGVLDPFEQGLQLDVFRHAMGDHASDLDDHEYMDDDEREEAMRIFGLDSEDI